MSRRWFALALALLLGLPASPSGALPRRSSSHVCTEHGAEASDAIALERAETLPGGKSSRGAAKEAKPEDKAESKWDVEAPPGLESYEVKLDVTEGTWLSLDVSPDGTEIAFDLLGDLYLLPIAGGEARSLTHGLSWDMQPRFSPDGKSIVFTSDRAGGDNVWIIGRDGKDPKQVTKESFRLLNSPTWSPDGEFIAARKHFTAERSLGSGEIWLYHRTGGGGLQLTTKPNDQKDVGEPAFSPDGRYVYFSQDTTPGGFFQYNKDPNGQIYVIRRLDRETGELIDLIGGAGGAVRPTPSPDGKSLAFVRRERGKSVLKVLDLASGSERALFDGLDRDMQETWAIHGVYPAMAWTPDGTAIVFWAAGGLHRVDVATAAVSPIPFHLRDTRKVLRALRSPQSVDSERFPVRMLRWVQVSPAGDRVLYQALGKIWLRDLPAGTPRRLTADDAHFELYPSFSRDGRSVVYIAWDDRELASIRIASVAAGSSRTVTTKPGHYVEPTFSPDGQTIVYRASTGGDLTSPHWSFDTGLYALPAVGGEAKKLTSDGFGAHFGAASDRVYFVTLGEKNARKLKSIALTGAEEREHAGSEFATELRVSPDGKWLAFVERFNAYVVPFPPTGKAIDLSPETSSIPQAKVSKDAGENLHWSGDSSTLHWSLGPELFSRPLKEAFSFLAGAPAKLPDPPSAGLPIGFEAISDRPTGKVAFVGGRVVTMKGDEVIEDGTVIVEGNRIVAVGPRGTVTVPPDAQVVDAREKTVLPGLVDVHWHGSQGEEEVTPQLNWYNYAALAFGVTTLHDPSNDTSEIFASAEMQRAGLQVAPRITSTGTILYGARAPFKAVIDSLDDARAHLKRMKAVGAFSVKSYNQPRRDQRQQVLAAAKELGMLVVPEGGSLFQHNMTMVADGHTGVEHSIPVGAIYEDVRQLWSGTDVGYTPTLVVGYGGLWGEEYWYATTDVWAHPRLSKFVPRERLDPRSRRRGIAPDGEWNHFNNARVATELGARGVKVNIGAHGQREGLAAHWEIWMLVQGGMSPHQALRAATWNGAHYLGLDHQIGSLEPGKLADVIVIEGNPLADIRQSDKVTYTMVNGRLYDAATMNEIGNRPRERSRFWWE